MIGRRALLLGGGVLLAGCTVGEGTIWLPWTAPSPLPVEAAPELPHQLATATALAQHLLDHGRAWKLTALQTDTLEWFIKALDEHLQVLLSDDPARRQRVNTDLPQVAKPTQRTAAATYAALSSLLTRLRVEHVGRALPATGPAALLWASLAAFSGTMALRLPTGLRRRGDDLAELTPDLTATTRDQVLALSLQATHSYEMALAATDLSKAQRTRLHLRLAGWRTLRESILALAPEVMASPPPIGYDVRPARNAGQAYALAETAETAALPILGAWLAGTGSAEERRLGIQALVATSTACVDVGGAALRWPGWPG